MRNYWRLVAQNRAPQGRDTQRTGYIAPGDNVPGATPSNVGKGGKSKCKGGKAHGKRSRADYEGGGSSGSSDQSPWSWWNPNSWSGWWGW